MTTSKLTNKDSDIIAPGTIALDAITLGDYLGAYNQTECYNDIKLRLAGVDSEE